MHIRREPAPQSHEERPRPIQMLPFRAETTTYRGRPCTILSYEGEVLIQGRGKQKLPFSMHVLTPNSPTEQTDPLGQNILELMAMYRALEAGINDLMKQRDDALTAARQDRAHALELEAKLKQYQGGQRPRKGVASETE